VPVRVVDYASMTVVADMEDSEETVSTVKWSPDGSLLAAGSWDQKAYLYLANEDFKLQFVLLGNASSIEHLNFSADGDILMTNSKDGQMLYYETSSGARINRTALMRDVPWAQWTCNLGWSVTGIWDPDYDQTDINGACQTHEGDLIALGDDYGMVKLLRYPATCGQYSAGYAAYNGHSSHVCCVRFSHDDTYLISVGGADASIFQWKLHRGVRPALACITEKFTPESRSIAQASAHSPYMSSPDMAPRKSL
jgi:WD40 repeat protein